MVAFAEDDLRVGLAGGGNGRGGERRRRGNRGRLDELTAIETCRFGLRLV